MKDSLKAVKISTPIVPVIQNYTALPVKDPEEIKENLLNQITGRVRWRQTMIFCEKDGIEEFVEIGNGKVLTGMVSKTCPNVKATVINSIASLEEYIENNK